MIQVRGVHFALQREVHVQPDSMREQASVVAKTLTTALDRASAALIAMPVRDTA
ncbi:hypothetical protein ACFY0N_39285 [Streptomyces vinaceus]|uniref:hypothetical protein n=1 Tax=Streptomyces vinaceus TaxID=1960 RepID=UPI0035D7ED80